jgi:anti-sigma regulatory factor (Ser/Thr protein kinase)
MSETRTGTGYTHELLHFDTTERLVEEVVPWLRQASARGETVALACEDEKNRALLEALCDQDRIVVLPRAEIYQKAVTAVAYYRDFMRRHLDAGGQGVRLVGELNFRTDSRAWDEWRRFEALCNHALAPFPLWSVCAYDTRVLPDPVLATGELTHPFLRRDGAPTPNASYVDPAELLQLSDAAMQAAPDAEPAATFAGLIDFTDLHTSLRTLLAGERLDAERIEDVIIAVHEVTTNALRHGAPPVAVRIWLSPGRVICTVTDQGPGYDDPFAGYVRTGDDPLPEDGLGLWIARQLCDELVTARTPDGFTTRLLVRH